MGVSMTIPEYFEAFVRSHFQDQHVDAVLDEFVQFASDGVGGSRYTHQTVKSLMLSRERGIAPEKLDCFGDPR